MFHRTLIGAALAATLCLSGPIQKGQSAPDPKYLQKYFQPKK
jgi:hypothetical protein